MQFDLEKAIGEWRKQALAAGVKSSAQLDELEGHLREEIERQMKSGLDPQQAVAMAVQTIGKATMLKDEFNKISRPSALAERIMIGIGLAFVALIIFLGGAAVVL